MSGVYARIAADGTTLTPLDQDGRALPPISAGAGLIAAVRHAEDAPVWVVTGTDLRGLELAARGFDRATLHDRVAVAITAAGARALPEIAP